MSHRLITAVLAFAIVAAATATPASAQDRLLEELTCEPVNGYIQLPGILYDDLTPLAREVFRDNPAAVTNALYALPFEEREDFLILYLVPEAREKHRYFFARCRELSQRREMASKVVLGGEVIPPALKAELVERERVRLALHEGAIPFSLGAGIVYIPIPFNYAIQDSPLPGFVDDPEFANNLALFRKADPVPLDGQPVPLVRHPILASVRHVREGSDNLATLIQAYRIMVDADWRLTGMYPPLVTPDQAETVEYKWNLDPFHISDNSFCYGQFEKTRDFHGVEGIRYRVTAIITMPGSYIQVSISHSANTGLDMVNEMNSDLVRWRDDILAANVR
ncbi:MAG: hypothetical protein LUC93_13880 [Planctomycetaceae bacterium]|nr:hypothetical protein [Planctomycetaceae bacterium]